MAFIVGGVDLRTTADEALVVAVKKIFLLTSGSSPAQPVIDCKSKTLFRYTHCYDGSATCCVEHM